MRIVGGLDFEVAVIKAQDSNTDIETYMFNIYA